MRHARGVTVRGAAALAATVLGAVPSMALALLLFAGPRGEPRPAQASGGVRPRDIDSHMRSLGKWVDWRHTCDTFKAGDPDREVKAVAVSWMSTLRALEEARRRGCDLFVTHEPTFYSHMDDDRSLDADRSTVAKRKLLDETGMVIYRCHDVWDRVPEVGILASWARCLGFEGKPVAEKTFFAVHEMQETSLGEFARAVATRLQRYGQDAVQVVGDLRSRIRKVAIGTGAITDARAMREMGADAAVVTEICYWRDVRWAQDMGFPLLIVSHAVSECPGVENLAKYLKERFPGVRVEYIEEGCEFRLVGPEGPVGGDRPPARF